MTRKPSRSKQDFLTVEEQNTLLSLWQARSTCINAARTVGCSKRNVQKYWGMFRSGWRPGGEAIHVRVSSDSAYVGPVEKRPMPAPNAIPSVLHKLTRGRA